MLNFNENIPRSIRKKRLMISLEDRRNIERIVIDHSTLIQWIEDIKVH